MQIEIQIPKAVLFDVKYTVEQATNFAKKEVALGFYMQKGVSVALCSQIAGTVSYTHLTLPTIA